MIASLDGAIEVDGRSGGLGRPADKALFHALRGVADVVLVGAGTARAEGYRPARVDPAVAAARTARGQAAAPTIAVVSRRLHLDPTGPLFSGAGPRPVVITSEAAPAGERAALGEVADVLVHGADEVDLAGALAELGDRGARVVTAEGGPSLNGDLVAADLVDEWALSVSPLLVGGSGPRAVVGGPPHAPRGYELARILAGDGLLLTRWVRER